MPTIAALLPTARTTCSGRRKAIPVRRCSSRRAGWLATYLLVSLLMEQSCRHRGWYLVNIRRRRRRQSTITTTHRYTTSWPFSETKPIPPSRRPTLKPEKLTPPTIPNLPGNIYYTPLLPSQRYLSSPLASSTPSITQLPPHSPEPSHLTQGNNNNNNNNNKQTHTYIPLRPPLVDTTYLPPHAIQNLSRQTSTTNPTFRPPYLVTYTGTYLPTLTFHLGIYLST
ncbi:hypothetical protein F4824DRAFT_76245 [Ustulina deusta]|nr:hypothetical protein F4824DRAFT_76245 [Ustulina deusta]